LFLAKKLAPAPAVLATGKPRWLKSLVVVVVVRLTAVAMAAVPLVAVAVDRLVAVVVVRLVAVVVVRLVAPLAVAAADVAALVLLRPAPFAIAFGLART